jgi:hypothetical protein
MLPEISRRCKRCGAAVRANATFCHQCGEPVNATAAAAAAARDGGEAESVEGIVAGRAAGAEPDASGVLTGQVVGETASVIGPVKDNAAAPGVAVEERAPSDSSAEAAGGERARAKLQRARAVARGAMEEKVAPRVEKLRQTSSVVLDEASDDPSLRFVLIAAVLFIFFLVLFFVSRLLG